jgi:hypothetical protein
MGPQDALLQKNLKKKLDVIVCAVPRLILAANNKRAYF